MANRNETRRQKRRRRVKMKTSFKRGLLVFLALICIGAYTGYVIYRNTVLGNMYGDVKSQDIQEDDSFTVTSGAVSYTVFDADDGEAILIRSGSKEALIDTGTEENAENLCEDLRSRISGSLDYLVITGPDEKRTGGLVKVCNTFDVGTCIVGDMQDMDDAVRRIISRSGEKVEGGDLSYDLGEDATLFIMKPEVSSADPRDRSLVTYFTFGRTGFLALSDAGEEEISRVFGSVDKCNVIVLARHGEDVNKVIPGSNYSYCVCSAAGESAFPSDETKESIRSKFYKTGADGILEFISDGSSVTLTNEDAIKEAQKEAEKAAKNEEADASNTGDNTM